MFFFVKHITKIILPFVADKVGSDDYGNTYYQHRTLCISTGQKRRFCFYDDLPESSKIPPLWHAWLHYMTNDLPQQSIIYPWYKRHLPNLSGTIFARSYRIFNKNKIKHYIAWNPNKQ